MAFAFHPSHSIALHLRSVYSSCHCFCEHKIEICQAHQFWWESASGYRQLYTILSELIAYSCDRKTGITADARVKSNWNSILYIHPIIYNTHTYICTWIVHIGCQTVSNIYELIIYAVTKSFDIESLTFNYPFSNGKCILTLVAMVLWWSLSSIPLCMEWQKLRLPPVAVTVVIKGFRRFHRNVGALAFHLIH